jgi:hypothetical protein
VRAGKLFLEARFRFPLGSMPLACIPEAPGLTPQSPDWLDPDGK